MNVSTAAIRGVDGELERLRRVYSLALEYIRCRASHSINEDEVFRELRDAVAVAATQETSETN